MWHVADVDRPDQPDLTESIDGQVIPLARVPMDLRPPNRGINVGSIVTGSVALNPADAMQLLIMSRWLLDAVASS
jgi:hypothetical protein